MSLELINTLATFGTFLVIAATAIAAVVQLRHARSSNHIAALNELRETMETPGFQSAQHFVRTQLPAKLQDASFRYQFANRSARTDETRPLIENAIAVGNFFENLGVLVKLGLVDKDIASEVWGNLVIDAWKDLEPLVPISRRDQGNTIWENFEYLTVLTQDWWAAHPTGTYPARVRRIAVKDKFLEADKQYAAALAPA
ncbi:MAG: DUF4760 domain-containing protein [Candidatus Eremiobacteraeota bacterium]|nr:DUF4760 domain-containing protein [Candidatus Eremiobacteraeota bacterium]